MNYRYIKSALFFGKNLLISHLLPHKKFVFSVSIIITTQCNQRCMYCIYYKKNITKEMTTSQIRSIIDNLVDYGIQRICFTGGEPLLREDLGELINYARKKRIFTTVVSNGLLLPDKIDSIKNLDILIISLDGEKINHERMRGKDTFDRVLNTLNICRNQKRWLTFTLSTITKYTTVEDLKFVIEIATKNNHYCVFQPVMYTESSAEQSIIDSLLPPRDMFLNLISFIVDKKKAGYPIAGSYKYFNLLRQIYNTEKKFNKQSGCWAGKGFCAIGPAGELAPCCVLLKEGVSPNVFIEGFFTSYRKISMVSSCQGCMAYSFIETSCLLSLDLLSLWEILSRKYLI